MKDAMPTDPKAPDPSVNALYTAITTDYFDALGVKLLARSRFHSSGMRTKRRASRRNHRRGTREKTLSERGRRSVSTFATLSHQRMARLTMWKSSEW